jgi:hypothetical protein
VEDYSVELFRILQVGHVAKAGQNILRRIRNFSCQQVSDEVSVCFFYRLFQQQHDHYAPNRKQGIGHRETNSESERGHAALGRVLNDR